MASHNKHITAADSYLFLATEQGCSVHFHFHRVLHMHTKQESPAALLQNVKHNVDRQQSVCL
jgi:hypothetical protein